MKTLETQFIEAIKSNNLVDISKCIDKGVNISIQDDYAIRSVSEYGHLETVKYLIEKGADFKADDNYAVKLASSNDHLETVKYLIEKGADFKDVNNYAVRYAVYNGYLETVKYLIEKGADIKADNNYAVRCTSQNGHLETVKYLIEKGADFMLIHNNLNKYKLLELLYSDGKFDLVNKIAQYYSLNSDLINNVRKIVNQRNNFYNKIKLNYYDLVILYN